MASRHLAPTNTKLLKALSDEDILAHAPSVFSGHPMPGVSRKYQFVKTSDIIETLRKADYVVTSAAQSASRTEDGHQYTKHALRLTRQDYIGRKTEVGGVVPQIVLTNSHNRTSSFQLSAAMWRLICANGMMLVDATLYGVRVLHNDPLIHNHVIEGTTSILETTEARALPMIEKMERLELSPSQVHEFAMAATLLKFGEVKPDHVPSLLVAQRPEDEGRSLWAVLNRVQENAVRGGYTAKDKAGRNVVAKGITSVDRDMDFNTQLWQLGAKVVESLA